MLKQIPKCLHRLPKIVNLPKRQYRRLTIYSQRNNVETNAQPTQPANPQASEEAILNNRFKYSDFLPDPRLHIRQPIRETLERLDMTKRRSVLFIPEFYVGSIVAVTTSDRHSPNKTTRFLGICISRFGYGLFSKFILRNVIENEGVEVLYELYNPTILSIDVMKLEKRLDDPLYYLRDAPLEYSTFPFDMEKVYHSPREPIPVNPLKVPLNPRPWLERYERMNLQGAIVPPVTEKMMKQAKEHETPWLKYDLMDQYRKTIPEEEQIEILKEVDKNLQPVEKLQHFQKRKKDFTEKTRQKLF